MKKSALICFIGLLFSMNIFADRTINLEVGNKKVRFAGKDVYAIAVNNQIPAPTLHFKQGELVTINVYNRLKEETAIHWHGILVPWQMDGVLGVSQHGIQPGKSFKYQFKLMQSGTYWYHAHAGLQEQQGLYGAFIIDPPNAPPYKYNKDYVVVLSDWTNTNPDKVLANLKKDGDYYSPRFPLQPSLVKFIHDYRKANTAERQNLIDDYKMMQQMRMSIYDINDVAYDAFLMNGHLKLNPWNQLVRIGDIVRLRFIGAGAETIFHVKIPGASMQMVHIDGNDVKPYEVNDFTIAPGETYDVLVKINNDHPYIIYAESLDTVGAAYGALTTRSGQMVNYKSVIPFPEPLPVTREMMANMMQGMSNESAMPGMNMNNSSTNAMSHHKMDNHKNNHEMMPNMKMGHDGMDMRTKNNSQHSTMDMSDHSKAQAGKTTQPSQKTASDPSTMNMNNGMSENHDGMNMGSKDNSQHSMRPHIKVRAMKLHFDDKI